jgi:DNA polymerase III epsilon subunit-like protein
MKIFAFDTETCGIIKDYKASTSEFEKFPCIAQIGFALYDHEAGQCLESEEHIIKPNGWTIPEEVVKIHGISQEIAEEKGVDLKMVLERFYAMQLKADFLCAYNASFDGKIIRAACCRVGIEPNLTKGPTLDPMMLSTKYCNIAGPRGPKWPKLTELYKILFDQELVGAHGALADVSGTMQCFFELEKRKVICASHYEEAIKKHKQIQEAVQAKIQRENKEIV